MRVFGGRVPQVPQVPRVPGVGGAAMARCRGAISCDAGCESHSAGADRTPGCARPLQRATKIEAGCQAELIGTCISSLIAEPVRTIAWPPKMPPRNLPP